MKTILIKFLRSRTAPLGLALLLGALWTLPLAAPAVAKEAGESGPLQLKALRTLKNDFVVNRLAWHPDNKTLAVGQSLNKKVTIWNIETGKVIRVIDKEAGGVGALAYSLDGMYLAVGRIATRHTADHAHAHLYNTTTGELTHRFVPSAATKGDANDVHTLVFSPDSRQLATHGYGGGAVGVVYELSNGNMVAALQPSTRVTDAVESLAWSPSGRFVALGRISGRLELWNATTWKLEKQRDVTRQRIGALTYSPDSRSIAFGGSKRTGAQVEADTKEFSKLPENFRRSHPTPAVMPHDIFVLDAESLTVTNAFASSHNGSSIQELTFTPNGKFLVSGAVANSVAVNEVNDGSELVSLKNFKQPAHPVLSNDGKYIAVGTGQEIELYEFTH